MKISLNWLKEYIQITEPAEEISTLLTGSGLEVETWEEVESLGYGTLLVMSNFLQLSVALQM